MPLSAWADWFFSRIRSPLLSVTPSSVAPGNDNVTFAVEATRTGSLIRLASWRSRPERLACWTLTTWLPHHHDVAVTVDDRVARDVDQTVLTQRCVHCAQKQDQRNPRRHTAETRQRRHKRIARGVVEVPRGRVAVIAGRG